MESVFGMGIVMKNLLGPCLHLHESLLILIDAPEILNEEDLCILMVQTLSLDVWRQTLT